MIIHPSSRKPRPQAETIRDLNQSRNLTQIPDGLREGVGLRDDGWND